LCGDELSHQPKGRSEGLKAKVPLHYGRDATVGLRDDLGFERRRVNELAERSSSRLDADVGGASSSLRPRTMTVSVQAQRLRPYLARNDGATQDKKSSIHGSLIGWSVGAGLR
jgi:hypothetical protein